MSESDVKVTQLCPTLCHPMDCTVHGILQATRLEWVAFPFSRGSSQPCDRTQVSRMAGGFFSSWATREAPDTYEHLGKKSHRSHAWLIRWRYWPVFLLVLEFTLVKTMGQNIVSYCISVPWLVWNHLTCGSFVFRFCSCYFQGGSTFASRLPSVSVPSFGRLVGPLPLTHTCRPGSRCGRCVV